jgi:hypothetical protein
MKEAIKSMFSSWQLFDVVVAVVMTVVTVNEVCK